MRPGTKPGSLQASQGPSLSQCARALCASFFFETQGFSRHLQDHCGPSSEAQGPSRGSAQELPLRVLRGVARLPDSPKASSKGPTKRWMCSWISHGPKKRVWKSSCCASPGSAGGGGTGPWQRLQRHAGRAACRSGGGGSCRPRGGSQDSRGGRSAMRSQGLGRGLKVMKAQ